MSTKLRNVMSGFEQVKLQDEFDDLCVLVEQLIIAVEIASDYLPQHWEMDSVPLNNIEKALLAVKEYNQTHETKGEKNDNI